MTNTQPGALMDEMRSPQPLRSVCLEDKYLASGGSVFLTGTQALVRLPLLQRQLDARRGLNTAGFISGYRGSPLGSYDRELWRVRKLLENEHVRFVPGVNEDLAATAVWGSQQIGLFPGSKVDGVFAIWYGKGAGIDRSCDAFRHANMAGTARHGGVLAIVGDDHGLKSSSQPYHSEPTFVDLQMPVLFPASLDEILRYGLIGWELSRVCGCWTGFKVLADTMDCSGTVDLDSVCTPILAPARLPSTDLVTIRWPDPWKEAEVRLHKHRLPAIHAFARAYELNRVVFDSGRSRLGIVASGKSWSDVQQALNDLGMRDSQLREAGIRLIKIAMPWPLDEALLREQCADLEEIIVVEEKRKLIEDQLRAALYQLSGRRPVIVGERDEAGRELLPRAGEHDPDLVARVLYGRLSRWFKTEQMTARIQMLDARQRQLSQLSSAPLQRSAFFCSGCPHNTSTVVPDGSRALGGVGCHTMAIFAGRAVTYTHMGAEGATWIGQMPFVDEPHVFANMGDGTYFHSGLLAIRACVTAGVSITYKILFNDAVAMTGGQPVEGKLTVAAVVNQILAEGVTKIVVVADDLRRYENIVLPGSVKLAPREQLDAVQKELRATPGVTALIYDQVCAAEKRRRRKRGLLEDPPERIFINRAVCEGCGDCSKTSNCLSVVPVKTELGLKRRIDQASCNKDYSCTRGFCPSFVVVEGALRRSASRADAILQLGASIPEAQLPRIDEATPYGILVTGIGGTGVITIGAVMGMAAHLDGLNCRVLDAIGLAQKGGAVSSHIRLSKSPHSLASAKLNALSANVLLGCDLLVSAEHDSLATLRNDATLIVNTTEAITGAQVANPDLEFPTEALERRLESVVESSRIRWVDANVLATRIFSDTAQSNMLMLGYAWQCGLIPLSRQAIQKAIELNGVAVEKNLHAFLLGRIAVARSDQVERLQAQEGSTQAPLELPLSVDALIARRARQLTDYQDETYAARYRTLVGRASQAAVCHGMDDRLTRAVVESFFKLLAYKDEYEVARLYSQPRFREELESEFEQPKKISVLLSPPLFARRDPSTGRPKKYRFGPWIFPLFRLLASLRKLRGCVFDPFGYTAERRLERELIREYEGTMSAVAEGLRPHNYELAVEIAALPQTVRGYGHVKNAAIERYRKQLAALMSRFHAAQPASQAA